MKALQTGDFDGTAARQLTLLDDREASARRGPDGRRPALRMLYKDVYAELTRRRRRAQIAARHALDAAPWWERM